MSSKFSILDVANEFERLSHLPEHAWDDEDYAKQAACGKKLRMFEGKPYRGGHVYKYRENWLVDDPDFIDALRERGK